MLIMFHLYWLFKQLSLSNYEPL